ncbi:MarR family winged helix-turn-helix transcriptional regulator [Breznakiella homolactica]|uniref:MarR family transcriptional regulator n=1 Tax=Breznakiella homolactica TaxID=2798577 RepID=A0A7T7XNF7_9SPIR|nr:MarR family transcriptional regulator [Breznakiella homolactica]QQO09518.1 MarR family transcriptional regulator [Breznakiella homolactica]
MAKKKSLKNPRLYIAFADVIRNFYSQKTAELEKLKLKQSQARLLHFLSDFEGSNQQDIAAVFGVGTSTVSELISALENDGLIVRKVNPDNKRMVFVNLTDLGHSHAKEIYRLFEQYCLEYLEGFTQDEVKTLEKLLGKFTGE